MNRPCATCLLCIFLCLRDDSCCRTMSCSRHLISNRLLRAPSTSQPPHSPGTSAVYAVRLAADFDIRLHRKSCSDGAIRDC
jgi:hypothetical protein